MYNKKIFTIGSLSTLTLATCYILKIAGANTSVENNKASEKKATVTNKTDAEIIAHHKARLKIDPLYETTRPMTFHGRVVSQENTPIEAAEITFAWNELGHDNYRKHIVLSDQDGQFTLSKGIANGKFISITDIKKEGFFWSHDYFQNTFEYGDPYAKQFHIPKASTPVSFIMISSDTLAPVYSKQFAKLLKHGEYTQFSLTNNKKKASIEIHPRIINNKSFTVEIKGLQDTMLQILEDTHTPPPYPHAPDNGYSNTVVINRSSAQPSLQEPEEVQLYYKSGSQGYGVANIKSRVRDTSGDSIILQVNFKYNPSGKSLTYNHSMRLR